MKLFILLFIFTASCSGENYSRSKIIGGSKDNFVSELKLSTVGLFKNDDSELCSGSLIAKNQILTAAHCIAGISTKDYYVLLQDKENNKSQKIRVKKQLAYDSWVSKSAFPNFDVATLILESNVDDHFKEIPIETDERVLTEDRNVILMGFGKFQNRCAKGEKCSGIKKAMNAKIKSYHNSNRLRHLLVFKSDKYDGVCHGDSGGPAYVKVGGVWKLIGITNGVDTFITPNASSRKCEKGDVIYTFAGRYKDWAFSKNKEDKRERTTQDEVDDKIGDFKDYSLRELCEYNRDSDKRWFSIDRTIQSFKRFNKEKIEDFFADCQAYEDRMLELEEYRDNNNLFAVMLSGLTPTRVVSFDIFSKLEKLKMINIFVTEIDTLCPLRSNHGLEQLQIFGNKLDKADVKLKGLGSLKALKKLQVFVNSISHGKELMLIDFEDFGTDSNIETLELQNFKLINLDAIANLKNLKKFSCTSCEGLDKKLIPEWVNKKN